VRSAVLDVMRQSTEADIAKPEFRTELAAKIKTVMNAMLMKYEDFGGIEDVFFTSFVMQ
jgi:flagellar FliL protein